MPNPILFVTVLETSGNLRSGLSLEVMYVNNLVFISNSLENTKKLRSMESRGIKVNISKTNMKVASADSMPVSQSGIGPYAVWKSGVGGNSIQCIMYCD